MKKLFKIIVGIFFSLHVMSQTTVHFIHGMNGDGNSLYRLYYHINHYQKANFVDPNTTIYSPLNYESTYGIKSSAIDIQEVISGATLNSHYKNSKNIVIAHSMGGLTARYWQLYSSLHNKKAYHGIITLATPHSGAIVANKLLEDPKGFNVFLAECSMLATEGIRNDAIGTVMDEFCVTKYHRGVLGTLLQSTALHSIRMNQGLQNMVNNAVSTVISKLIGEIDYSKLIIDNIVSSSDVLDDLKKGSEVIKQLVDYENEHAPNMFYDYNTYKIALFGEEIYPSFFRMVSSSLYNDKMMADGDKINVYNECDEELIEIFNSISQFCNTRYTTNLALSQQSYWFREQTKRLAYFQKALCWIRSQNFFDKIFNDALLKEMGLVNMIPEKITMAGTLIQSYRTIIVPNDGLVSTTTQQKFKGAVQIHMYKINHEEMKMEKKVERELYNIFHGLEINLKQKSEKYYEYFKLYHE